MLGENPLHPHPCLEHPVEVGVLMDSPDFAGEDGGGVEGKSSSVRGDEGVPASIVAWVARLSVLPTV